MQIKLEFFYVLFLFFISEYVDLDDDYHKFLAQLIQICHVVFAPIISNKTIEQLTLMIKEHLRLFKTLFPAENVDPKQHYTLHFPKLIRRNWPLIRSHCFNYESTRNYYKILDRQQNLKNLLLSLAKRHQNLESWTVIELLVDIQYSQQKGSMV